jgi:photosystem II stability/assembly factor-like uncharacterized protein
LAALTDGGRDDLSDIFFLDGSRGWAVGARGKILSTTSGGKDWITRPSVTRERLNAVIFVDQLNGWAVGDRGTILHSKTGGLIWRSSFPVCRKNLTGIFFASAKAAGRWARAGSSFAQAMAVKRGKSARRTPKPGSKMYALIEPTHGIAVGSNGTILRSEDGGENWKQIDLNLKEWLYAVAFADALRGYAVGANGIILRTDDGGVKWKDQESGISSNLFAVSVASPTTR